MANAKAIVYDLPTDKVTGTWAQDGGTLNASYPLTNIDNDQPWLPTIFTINPTRIKIDFGTAKRVDLVSFIHCNFDAAAVIKVEMNATDSWGAPSLTTTVVIPTVGEDGMPGNPFVDLTGVAGYSVGGYRWLSIKIQSSQSTLLSLGLVRLTSTKRTVTNNVQDGVRVKERQPVIEHGTEGGVQLAYARGIRERTIEGAIQTSDAGIAALLTSWRATKGRTSPFLLVFDPTVNEAIFVKWGSSPEVAFDRTYTFLNLNDMPVSWVEVGRGLKP